MISFLIKKKNQNAHDNEEKKRDLQTLVRTYQVDKEAILGCVPAQSSRRIMTISGEAVAGTLWWS